MAAEKSNLPVLNAEELRVGLFVVLDLPWFKHPFARSSFKVTSQEQVDQLRALNLTSYCYDPERSDPEPGATLGNLATVKGANAATPQTKASSDPVTTDPTVDLGQAVTRVERSFAKASGMVRSLQRDLIERPAVALENVEGMVGQMVETFLSSADATLHLLGERAGSEDVYYHNLNVTILSMMLARDLGFSERAARDLGVGAMLHDIGLSEIPDRVTKKNADEMTAAERQFKARHVEYGIEIGRRIGLAPEALRVIAEHHELCDGSGFPRGLKLDEISLGARLVALVNHYDNLCNPPDISRAVTPHEALSSIFTQKKGKYDPKATQLMVKKLGVYPPGSIVHLSNDALAAVVNINPHRPMRPVVRVYDASVPRERAPLLDLSTHPEINISRTVRPAVLPPKVASYLSPRKRVTYFFDAERAQEDA